MTERPRCCQMLGHGKDERQCTRHANFIDRHGKLFCTVHARVSTSYRDPGFYMNRPGLKRLGYVPQEKRP